MTLDDTGLAESCRSGKVLIRFGGNLLACGTSIIALFRERVLGVSWTAVIALAVNIVHWFIVSRMFSVVLPA